MITIAICDDNIAFSGQLEMMLIKLSKESNIEVDIDVFFSGKEICKKIYIENKKYDIIFLDIEIGDINGIQVAKLVREKDQTVLIFFVTSYSNYALDGYEVQPFQFLLKPIKLEILSEYYKRACEKIFSETVYFEYKYQKDYYRILLQDILYFQSKRRVIYIHTVHFGVQKYYDKLNNIEQKLQDKKIDFWRIHRSLYVNTRYIQCKAYDHVKLVNNEILYISAEHRKEISQKYFELIEQKYN